MRKPRIKLTDCVSVYHCITRAVGGQFLFEERDREMFQRMAWRQADFCGVQLITHSILSSHAHFEVRVPDPKDYRFCGYGEAVGGNRLAQMGLLSFLGTEDWEQGGAEYRMRLFVEGGAAGESGKAVLDREAILEVLKAGGKIGCRQAGLRRTLRFGCMRTAKPVWRSHPQLRGARVSRCEGE